MHREVEDSPSELAPGGQLRLTHPVEVDEKHDIVDANTRSDHADGSSCCEVNLSELPVYLAMRELKSRQRERIWKKKLTPHVLMTLDLGRLVDAFACCSDSFSEDNASEQADAGHEMRALETQDGIESRQEETDNDLSCGRISQGKTLRAICSATDSVPAARPYHV